MSNASKTIGRVRGLAICPVAGAPMIDVPEVEAIVGMGLTGDRYATGEGSWNRKSGQGHRQVTLINAAFFSGSGFMFLESRRNILIEGLELMFWLCRGAAQVGGAMVRAVKYCDPCDRPNTLSGNPLVFRESFFDRGGLIVEVLGSGIIKVGDAVIPPSRD